MQKLFAAHKSEFGAKRDRVTQAVAGKPMKQSFFDAPRRCRWYKDANLGPVFKFLMKG